MTQNFDVLIIGAGSAGCVIANRMSADPNCSVGLIEAGEFPSDPDIKDPLKWPALAGRDFDWAYQTTPQAFTADRIHDWPRGRIVGGSSCLHAMAHVRGHRDDYLAWHQAGGDQWSFDTMLEAFKRSEKFPIPEDVGHGYDGPLDIYLPSDDVSPVARAFMAAGNALGVPQLRDHNSGPLAGTAPNSLSLRNGQRLSVADAYLTPEIQARQNLTLITGWEIDRLRIDGRQVVEVVATRDNETWALSANQIVLCAGSVSTPLLLMRSGIGDPSVLAQAGITCRVDNAQIGANLQDHLLALGNVYRSAKPVPPSRLQHSESLMYLNSEDVTRSDASPDVVLACVVAPSVAPGLAAPPYGAAYTILCGVTHPTSRGRIIPGGPDRRTAPLIDPHYLETEYDRTTFRKALKLARTIGHHSAMDEWRDVEVLPGVDITSDEAMDAFIARAASTHHHPCGTCRMGNDAAAVVDPDLRLNGLENVFVVDASIIPRIPSGPINALVVAIAENWAAHQHA